MATFMILLTLCAFVMPAFTVLFYSFHAEAAASYDADCGTMEIKKAEHSDSHQKSKSDKAADNCCISHHCCTAKLVLSHSIEAAVFAAVSADLPVLANQHVSGQIIHGLDRPPKSFV